MKNLRYIVILLMVIAGTIHLPAAIVEFGSDTQTSWTASAGDECGSGSTVRLNGVVATLGSAADDAVNWTWYAGNQGLLPAQMPSTDGTTEGLITSFSATAPFGPVPTHGAFVMIKPTKAGAVIISGKASANATQPIVFLTCDKNDPSTIISAKITAWDAATTEWTQEVDADFDVTSASDVRVGIRTGNKMASGGTDNSGETGTFRVDYFQLYYLGNVENGISSPVYQLPGKTIPYSLSGYPVANPQNGIYIINGRKVVINQGE